MPHPTALHRHDPARLPGLALTIGLHVAVIVALLSYGPVRQTIAEIAPIMVSLVQPQPVIQPQELPKPKPVVKQPPKKNAPRPQPVLAIPETIPTPAPVIAPPPPPEPAPILPEVVAPPPVVAPRFDAAYLNNPAPRYPALSRRLGEEGRVMLRVFVDAQGLPERIELRTSSGHERLDKVALDTVRRWKFTPARRGDQAISAWVLVPISFSLRS